MAEGSEPYTSSTAQGARVECWVTRRKHSVIGDFVTTL